MRLNPHATVLFSLRQFQLIKCSFFIHSTTLYIHPRLDPQIEPKFYNCALCLFLVLPWVFGLWCVIVAFFWSYSLAFGTPSKNLSFVRLKLHVIISRLTSLVSAGDLLPQSQIRKK